MLEHLPYVKVRSHHRSGRPIRGYNRHHVWVSRSDVLRYPFVQTTDSKKGYSLKTPYDPDIVSAIKAIPGRKWNPDQKVWMVPDKSRTAMGPALARIHKVIGRVASQRAAADKARREKWAAEKAQWKAQKAADRAARPAPKRFPVHPNSQITLGMPMRLYGKPIVVTGFGKPFRADSSFPSIHGHEWLGYEGEKTKYAYYRDATPEETKRLEGLEAIHKQTAEAKAKLEKVRRECISFLRSKFDQGDRPPLGSYPKGETLLKVNQHLAPYGGGEEYVLSGQDLWFIQGNGGDGDNWSLNNVPGAIATRIPATPELVAKIRKLA